MPHGHAVTVEVFILKLLLAPALIGLASWVARRWGPQAGGWFAALPMTSGPVILILALEQGPGFTKQACIGVLLAVISLAAFAVAYAWSARRWHWSASSLIGCAAYLACTWRLHVLSAPLGWSLVAVCAVLAAAVHFMPTSAHTRRATAPPAWDIPLRTAPPAWDIPLRMVLACVLIWGITRAASAVGPRLSGLLTPFPVVATILAAFTHHAEGGAAAGQFLRSLLMGLYSFAVFFLVVGTMITRWSIGAAFVAATGSALAVHAVIWRRMHHAPLSISHSTGVLHE